VSCPSGRFPPRWVRARIALVAAAFCALAPAASAQQAAVPVEHSPAHLPVIGGSLIFAQGAGFAGSGTLRSFGGRLHYGTGTVRLVAGAHWVSTDFEGLDDGFGLQGSVALSLVRPRPARAVDAQVGFGWLRLDTDTGEGIDFFDLPIGVGIGIYAPTPAGPAELWAAPRVHLRHVELPNDVASATRIGPGASAGVRFTLAGPQAGFDLILDGLTLRDPVRDDWRFMGSVSLGLHLLLLR
jgi:opacity protein-like surface antigen